MPVGERPRLGSYAYSHRRALRTPTIKNTRLRFYQSAKNLSLLAAQRPKNLSLAAHQP